MQFVILGTVDGVEGAAGKREVSVEVGTENTPKQFVRDRLYKQVVRR